MSVNIEVIQDPAQFGALAADWDRLVVESQHSANGLDATTGHLWFSALTQTFEQAQQARIVVLREGGQIVGLLPLVASGGKLCKRLMVATEIYGGRNGFMLKRNDPILLGALLRGIGMAYGPWHSLKMMIVEGSPSDQLLQSAGPGLGLNIIGNGGWDSPYFPLLDSHEEFVVGMSKGLKQTIRTSTNKFKTMGELRYVDIAPPQTPATLIDAILAVERASWKHESGTAITRNPNQERFYRELFPAGIEAGLIFGVIMFLNESPIAFNFGLLRSGIFSCLKHSDRQDHQNLSPNQLLNVVLIERLRARGVKTYDYMGHAEPHKMRWSGKTQTYFRHPTWIYGASPCGMIGYVQHRLKQALRHRRSNAEPTQPSDQPA